MYGGELDPEDPHAAKILRARQARGPGGAATSQDAAHRRTLLSRPTVRLAFIGTAAFAGCGRVRNRPHAGRRTASRVCMTGSSRCRTSLTAIGSWPSAGPW